MAYGMAKLGKCYNCGYYEPCDHEGKVLPQDDWSVAGSANIEGRCHRYPPTPIASFSSGGRELTDSRHPETHPFDWCGEWVPRPHHTPDL